MNMNAQQLIIMAVVGIIAGWLASLVVGGPSGLIAYLVTGLIGAFTANVEHHPEISAEVREEVGVRVQGRVSFVSADQVRTAAGEAGLDQPTTDAVVASYEDAQLRALKTALLFAGFIVLAAFAGVVWLA